MKILIPLLGFGKGGGNRVLSELANYWTEMGHYVCFICLNESEPPYFPTQGEIKWIDKHGKITISHSQFQQVSLFKIFGQVRRLKTAIDSMGSEFDVILANQALTSYPVYLSKSNALKYYYIQAYEAGYSFYQFSIKNWLMGLVSYLSYELPLRKIVNSPIYYKYKNIRSKIYIPPGMDFLRFYPKNVQSIDNSFNIGCVGRLEKFKGTLDVFTAFKMLVEQGKNVNLHVAYGQIENYDKVYHDRIRVSQPKNDQELGEFYRTLDVLIAPGTVQFYAHHYPVMEAMATKVPVITTGYLPADRSNAWIVGPYAPDQIAQAVVDIMNNSDDIVIHKTNLAFSNVQYYTWHTIAEDFIKVFSKHEKNL